MPGLFTRPTEPSAARPTHRMRASAGSPATALPMLSDSCSICSRARSRVRERCFSRRHACSAAAECSRNWLLRCCATAVGWDRQSGAGMGAQPQAEVHLVQRHLTKAAIQRFPQPSCHLPRPCKVSALHSQLPKPGQRWLQQPHSTHPHRRKRPSPKAAAHRWRCPCARAGTSPAAGPAQGSAGRWGCPGARPPAVWGGAARPSRP